MNCFTISLTLRTEQRVGRAHHLEAVLVLARLHLPLLQLVHLSHARAFVDLLEELLHGLSAALGLALYL